MPIQRSEGEVTVLVAHEDRLVDGHDLVMFDLDGVVYVGDDAVPGAVAALRRLREAETHVAFITNNASRPPGQVAEKLSSLGVDASVDDVVTSAQAAARVLWKRFGAGAPVAVLGAAGLVEALAEADLVATDVEDASAVALVSGYGPDVPWREVMRAASRIRAGLPWIASNTDLSLPTPHGPAPGHGVMVDMLSRFAGVTPTVAGKPQQPLFDETVRRVGGERPLMVGDRLDTDIEGARAVGVPSLLVLTGVTGLEELVSAREHQRPTYVAPDLSGLFTAHAAPTRADRGGWQLGGWRTTHEGSLRVEGEGDAGDWWRVVCAAAWEHLDAEGAPPDTTGLVPPVTTSDG